MQAMTPGMLLQTAAILVLGLMCGSELNVALFGHPILNRLPLEVHIPVRSALAALLGRVMPFWMPASAILNLLLVLPVVKLNERAWRLAVAALAIQALASLFSLIGPVPINNRIARWTIASLPKGWRAEERRWDVYHALRTAALIVAFVLLILSTQAS